MEPITTERILLEVAEERKEQIEKHGRTREYDLEKNKNWELKDAAVALLGQSGANKYPKNWDPEVIKNMHRKGYRERLIKAISMLVAEVERVDGIALQKAQAETK